MPGIIVRAGRRGRIGTAEVGYRFAGLHCPATIFAKAGAFIQVNPYLARISCVLHHVDVLVPNQKRVVFEHLVAHEHDRTDCCGVHCAKWKINVP